MIAKLGLGTIGFLLGGPLGAVALGALGATLDAQDADNAAQEAIDRQNCKHDPSWNAATQRWETAYTKSQYVAEDTPPTRATTSRWVDPVDPAFTD